jgi:hypothetical protein
VTRFAAAKDTVPADRHRMGGRSRGASGGHSMSALHDAIGNRGMMRLLTPPPASAPQSIQRRACPGASSSDSPLTRETLRDLGSGQPLEQTTRAPIEAGLGFDVSGVRIHTDPGAAQAARDIRAEAFAFGQDIYFGSGRYRPDTQGGRHLLTHELVHTVQQRASGPPDLQASPVLGATDDSLEREAATIADRVTDATAQGKSAGRIAPGRAAPAIQRQPETGTAHSNAPPQTYRPAISARDVAAFGPKPPGWDSQFGQPSIGPDPTISDLKAGQSERLKFNPGAKELDGVELAQAWTGDLGEFESAERRRYRIDQLVETMLDQLPADLWLPSDAAMQRSLYRDAEVQVIESNRQLDPTPIRSKLFTRLKALRGEKIDPLVPVEPVWNEALGDMVAAGIDTGPFTDEDNLILWFMFPSEMREWARREVAVQASVRQEHERRAAVVTSAAAGGALQFIAVGSIPAMLGGAMLALPAAAAVATEASATGAAASDFALSTGLRVAPRAVAWALANPQTAVALTTVGANVGHDLWTGDFSGWNIPFYLAEIWGARMGDRPAQASSPVGELDEIGEQAMAPSQGGRGGGDFVIEEPVLDPATGTVSQKITSPTGGGTFVGEYDTATGRKTITNVATGEVMVLDPGTAGPALGPGQSAGEQPPTAAGSAPAIDVADTTADEQEAGIVAILGAATGRGAGGAPATPLLSSGTGARPPLMLRAPQYEDFADLSQQLAQQPGSGIGEGLVWSVTPDGTVFATPPMRGVPIYSPGGVTPPAGYFAGPGQPRSWVMSGPLQEDFSPFDVFPGQAATGRTLPQVRSTRGPNLRGSAGSQHVAELSAGEREVTLQLPANVTRRSDVISPSIAGSVNQEVKNYLRYIGQGNPAREVRWTAFMQTEIDRDAMIMAYYRQQSLWVFTDAPPSAALILALDTAGIPYIVSSDRLPAR